MQKNLEELGNLVEYVRKWFESFPMQNCINALINYLTTHKFKDLLIGDPLLDSVPMQVHRKCLNRLFQSLTPAALEQAPQTLAPLLRDMIAQRVAEAETIINKRHTDDLRTLEAQIAYLIANVGRTSVAEG